MAVNHVKYNLKCTETHHFQNKIFKKIAGRAPLYTPFQTGRGYPLPTLHPLDAYDASILTPVALDHG